MTLLISTDWPPEFPDPVAGLDTKFDPREFERSGNSDGPVFQQRGRMMQDFKISIGWEMTGEVFHYFQAWYRHRLFLGVRGCRMSIPIGETPASCIIWFYDGYNATANDTLTMWAVNANIRGNIRG